MLVSIGLASFLPQDHSPTPGQVSSLPPTPPHLSNSLPPGKLLFPSYLHPILLKGTCTFPLNPYPSLKSQLGRLEAFAPRVLSSDSGPRSAMGGRAAAAPPRRSWFKVPTPQTLPPPTAALLSQGSRRTRCLSSAPCHPPDPGRPGSPHLPPLSDRGHSQFCRPPRLPEHRETPGSP